MNIEIPTPDEGKAVVVILTPERSAAAAIDLEDLTKPLRMDATFAAVLRGITEP